MSFQFLNMSFSFGFSVLVSMLVLIGVALLARHWLFKTNDLKARDRTLVNSALVAVLLIAFAGMSLRTASTYGPRNTLNTWQEPAVQQQAVLPEVKNLSPQVTTDEQRIQQMRELATDPRVDADKVE